MRTLVQIMDASMGRRLTSREVAEARRVLAGADFKRIMDVPCATRVVLTYDDGPDQVLYDSRGITRVTDAERRERAGIRICAAVDRAARMLDDSRRDAIVKASEYRRAGRPEYQVGYEIGLANAYEIAAKAVRDAVR